MQHTAPLETSERHDPTPPVQQALLPWLGLLQQLYPPNGVLLVGAGGGTSPWVQHLMASGHRNVTLIEADETTAARLKLVAQAQPSWKVLAGLVGPESTHTLSYTASLQPESGLLEPESLRSLWPNLKTTHQQTRQAITLAELQQDTEYPANWLLVDCLPALPILQGAVQQLAAFDVIALRVLLGSTQDTGHGNGDSISYTHNNELTQSASANALHPALQALGFRCLAIETSRHPDIGHALFVRDTAVLAKQQQQQLDQQVQRTAEAQATATAATTATAAATKQAEERATQVQHLTQAKAAADKLATERQLQLDQLQAQLKQAKTQAEGLAIKVQAYAENESNAAQLNMERQNQIDVLNQAAAKLKTEFDAALVETQKGFQTEILALAAASEAERTAHAKEKNDLLKSFQESLKHEKAWLAHSCIVSDDVHESAKKIIVTQKLTDKELFDFLLELSDQIAKSGDKLTALSYLNQSQKALTQTTVESLTAIAKRLINLGRSAEAEALYINAALDGKGVLMLTDKERALIKNASNKLHELAEQKTAHGHDLLISAMKKHLGTIKAEAPDRKIVLLEVGTTREEVPGQGSTRKLAEYCKANDVEFITVDMDPHNSEMARKTFGAMNSTGFQAVTSKGEDYLRHYSGALDIVFLDAYDFDHGKHSELRQSRYEKFLGSRIDEMECHQMHLDCAQSVVKKLSPLGLVCFDDTWLEDGKWTAKGTLGMPFLLANGFEVVEARNNAALLRRVSPQQNTSI